MQRPGAEMNAEEGFSQAELSDMLESAEFDDERNDLFSRLIDDFDTADADGNGKISREEAMAFDQSNKEDEPGEWINADSIAESQVSRNLSMLMAAYGNQENLLIRCIPHLMI